MPDHWGRINYGCILSDSEKIFFKSKRFFLISAPCRNKIAAVPENMLPKKKEFFYEVRSIMYGTRCAVSRRRYC